MSNLRLQLHQLAERSNHERQTAAFVANHLKQLNPTELLTDVGTTGVVALFSPTPDSPLPDSRPIALRAELDALPIPETIEADHASNDPTTSHRCGHDAHTAALLHLAESFTDSPPARPVILLFQPAEETGDGALDMLADARFQDFWSRHTPELTLAVHNAPGLPAGAIALREGPICCATTALTFHFVGSPSHAAEPHHANRPAPVLSQLIHDMALTKLDDDPASVITVAFAHLAEHPPQRMDDDTQQWGGPNFGMTPAHASLGLTLRAETTPNLHRLSDLVKARVQRAAPHLTVHTEESDFFPENTCHPDAVAFARTAADTAGLATLDLDLPFPFGEDFIHLINATPESRGALVGFGVGEQHPRLHTLGYDFPDELLPKLVDFWKACVR